MDMKKVLGPCQALRLESSLTSLVIYHCVIYCYHELYLHSFLYSAIQP